MLMSVGMPNNCWHFDIHQRDKDSTFMQLHNQLTTIQWGQLWDMGEYTGRYFRHLAPLDSCYLILSRMR